MSYILPAWEVDSKDKKAFRMATIEAGIARAQALGLAHSREELVATPLFASNLGMDRWEVKKHNRRDPFLWINYQAPIGIIIAIYKITILSPLQPGVIKLMFQVGPAGASTKAIFELSQLYAIGPFLKALNAIEQYNALKMISLVCEFEGGDQYHNKLMMEGYFTEPIIYDPHDLMYIKLRFADERKACIILSGFIISRIGMVVS